MASKWWEAAPVVEQQAPQQRGGVFIADQGAIDDARRADTSLGIQVQGNERDARREVRDVNDKQFDQTIKLADQYNRDPTIAGYRESLANFATGLKTGDNPQGDNALITAYVKVFDPGSVVNEGEREGVASSQGALNSLIEKAKRDFGMSEAGMFTPEARQGIRSEMINIMGKRVKGYNQRREYYGQQAQQFNLDPTVIIGNHDADALVPLFREYDQANGLGEFAPGREQQSSLLNPAGGRSATEQDNAALGPGDKFLYDETGNPIAIQSADGTISGYSQIVDDASAREAEMAVEKELGGDQIGGNVAFENGLFPWSDELMGVRGGIESLINGGSFMEGYQKTRDFERAAVRLSEEEHGMAPKLVGSLLTPAGLVSKANLARDALAVGAMYGAGEGEGLADTVGKTLTGGALGYGAGKAIEAATPVIANSAIGQRVSQALGSRTQPAAEFADAAARQGLDYLPADIPGRTGTQMATSFAKATIGGVPLAEAATKIVEKAKAARDRIAGNIGTVASDATGAGQSARKGLEAWERKTEGRGGELFEAIPIPPKTEVSAENTRNALAEITRGLESNPELSRLWTENPRLKATLDALTPRDVAAEGAEELAAARGRLASAQADAESAQSRLVSAEAAQRSFMTGRGSDWGAPGSEIAAARREAEQARADLADAIKRSDAESSAIVAAQKKSTAEPEGGKISWQDISRLRSIVGQITGKPSLSSDGAADAAMRKFYGALTQDIQAAAATHSPEAAKAFSRANNYWRGRQDRIDSVLVDLLGKKGDASPESTFAQIERWAGYKGGDYGKLARAIRSMPDDEANTVRATIIDRLGDASAGRQGAAREAFSPDTFLSQWASLSDRAKAILFQGDHRKALDDLATVFEGSKFSRNFDNNSKTGLINTGLTSGALALTSFPLALASTAAQFLSGKLLASPRFARWLAASAKKPNPSAQLAHVNQLTAIARSEPIIANDIFTLQERLAAEFSRSPGSLAAQDTGDGRGEPPAQGERGNAP